MIRATMEASAFAMELTLCSRCGALLSRYDFGTDDLGRTLERCPKCGPALLVIRRRASVAGSRPRGVLKPCGNCAECGEPLSFRTGGKPERCKSCQKERRLIESREYKRDVTAHRRVVTPRRFSA